MEKKKTKAKEKHPLIGNKRHAVLFLAAAASVVWLIMFIGKLMYSHYSGQPWDFTSIYDNVMDNILGILPPIIIIDLAFEALTQKFVSQEISEQITATLMGNPDTIRQFDKDARMDFLKATIDTMKENGVYEKDMVVNAVAPYIENKFNLRKNFNYTFSLWNDRHHLFSDSDDYMIVNESLRYGKQYIAAPVLGHSFYLGFFTNDNELDDELRSHNYLFRESLRVHPEFLRQLIALPKEAQKQFVTEKMSLRVYIDGKFCTVENVEISDKGIVAEFSSMHDLSDDMLSVDISFNMPQLKKNASLYVCISEPTYGADISLTYDPQDYDITMYSFFSDLADARLSESDHSVGKRSVCIQNKWIYPLSGLVFNISAVSSSKEEN